ncbi:MAG: hypothetical protein ACXVPU_10525 [Bacteroidia bacterium]
MKQIILFLFIFILTSSYSQKSSFGIRGVDGKYQLDTNVILNNLNLDQLIVDIENSKMTSYKSKTKIPKQVTKFLKYATESNFSIANPGEDWNWGCVGRKRLADRQLTFVALSKDYCVMNYYSGGRGKFRHIVIFKFKNNQIVDFWSGLGCDCDTLENAIAYIKKVRNTDRLQTNFIFL